MATYAIGDIQGCFETLEKLLHRISFSPDSDRLWLVGDLVNRGPSNVQVLRWAKGLGASVSAVLGNHDLHLLSRHFGVSKAKKRDTLEDVLAAPDRAELIDWLLSRPFLVTRGEMSLVHAGLLPQWSLAEARSLADAAQTALQTAPESFLRRLSAGSGDALENAVAAFTRVRTCTPEGEMHPDFSGPPEDAPKGFAPWFAQPTRRTRGHTVVFGHWAALGLSKGSDWRGIDSGCVWGEQLTALRIEDDAVFQEESDDPGVG